MENKDYLSTEDLDQATGGKIELPDGPLMPDFDPSKLIDPDGDFSSTIAD